MRAQHYVNIDNEYLGGFADGAEPPKGSIEVPAPKTGRDTWDGESWIPYDDTAEELAATDSDMPRLGEDTINILLSKGVISLDDFSEAAREKLSRRLRLREQMKGRNNDRI